MKKRIVIHLDSTVSKGHENIINWLSGLPADNRGTRYKDEIVELLNAAISGNSCGSTLPKRPEQALDNEIVFLEEDYFNDKSEAQVKPSIDHVTQPKEQPCLPIQKSIGKPVNPIIAVDTQPLEPDHVVSIPQNPPRKFDKSLFKAKMKAIKF